MVTVRKCPLSQKSSHPFVSIAKNKIKKHEVHERSIGINTVKVSGDNLSKDTVKQLKIYFDNDKH